MIEKKEIGMFKDLRGLLMWANTEIIGLDYKYLTVGTMVKGVMRGNHYHKRITEKLLVVSGKIRFKLDDEEMTLIPGDLVLIPKGVVHTIFNDEDELAVFIEFKDEDFTKDNPDIHIK
jgi:mannose-6-phosphate isomerase-like protein (cupin superfamily)